MKKKGRSFMLVNPKRVKFSSKRDVLDYVTKGFFPPRKVHFNRVLDKLRTPDQDNEETRAKLGREVVILNNIMSEEDRNSLKSVIEDIYANRVRNRNILFGTIGVVGLLKILSSIVSSK